MSKLEHNDEYFGVSFAVILLIILFWFLGGCSSEIEEPELMKGVIIGMSHYQPNPGSGSIRGSREYWEVEIRGLGNESHRTLTFHVHQSTFEKLKEGEIWETYQEKKQEEEQNYADL